MRLDEHHWYATVRRSSGSPTRPNAYDHLVVAFDALEELDGWLKK